MERLSRLLTAGAGMAFLLSSGCTGNVGGSTHPGVPPAGAGASAATPSTGSGGAGMPGMGTGGTTKPVVTVPTSPPQHPGYVVVRRLNATEYNNTVADLLGTKLRPADAFPSDDLGAEFDTVGSSLSLSPEYLNMYENAANTLITDLFADPTRQKTVATCDVTTGGDACAKTILTGFARRAWRRPATADEVINMMTPVAAAKALGLTPVDGIKAALTGVLIAPYFLFKMEVDPNPLAAAIRRLSSYELATRLSYALWSTMPDAVLSAAADVDQLTTDAQVSAQVDRMLADARADRLLDNFAAMWLDLKEDSHDVDATLFPKYTPAVGVSMKAEARRFMQEFLRGPLNVTGLLDARFTFVDAPLAAFYGLQRTGATNPAEFVKVDTTGTERQGLLTTGAFLMATAYPNRTSPVRRGEYVFRRLLCDVVPEPPPQVPVLSETVVPGQTLRQRLEAHRANPMCRPCHDLMDPIGFGLENYDAIGAYRTMDSGAPIDSQGMLRDGTPFSGAVQLAGILAKDPRVPQCVTEKFMTFAIGRLLNQPDDGAWIGYLSARVQASGGSLAGIIRAVAMSDAFRSRQSGVQM